jgi:hypothetical protein
MMLRRALRKKAPQCGAFHYLPVGEPGPAGESVEPLGEGLRWVFPDGFTPLFRAAAALPALLVMPVLGSVPVALPVVVPPVEDPVVVPLVAAPPVAELPPVEVPLDCASAKLPVKTNAVANANVASFMIAPFPGCIMAQHDVLACVPAWPITDRCRSVALEKKIASPADISYPNHN